MIEQPHYKSTNLGTDHCFHLSKDTLNATRPVCQLDILWISKYVDNTDCSLGAYQRRLSAHDTYYAKGKPTCMSISCETNVGLNYFLHL